MLIFTRTSLRSLHTSRQVWNEWTKASLRRLKKPELVQLAQECHISGTGTKNELIIRLLSHQTAKIVGRPTSHTPAVEAKSQPTPHTPAVEAKSQPTLHTTAAEPAEADTQWMNAFEMKVAQRRGAGNKNPFHAPNKPHPMNDNLKKPASLSPSSVTESAAITEEEEPVTEMNKEKDDDDDEINKEWVKAFDLKVGSRGPRKHYVDTLTPTISQRVSEITFDSSKAPSEVPQPSQHDATIQKNHPTLKEQKSTTLITSVIGSSMLVWYFGGSEGFSNIWHMFSS